MPLVQFKILGRMLKTILSVILVHSTVKVPRVGKAIFVMVGAAGGAGYTEVGGMGHYEVIVNALCVINIRCQFKPAHQNLLNIQ